MGPEGPRPKAWGGPISPTSKKNEKTGACPFLSPMRLQNDQVGSFLRAGRFLMVRSPKITLFSGFWAHKAFSKGPPLPVCEKKKKISDFFKIFFGGSTITTNLQEAFFVLSF